MSEPGIFEPLLTDREIGAILGDAAMAQAMVEVERALARVQGRLGVIDAAAARRIDEALAGLVPDLADLARGTATAGVPVPALVAQLRRAVGGEAGQLVHWGATSQDIVDTAWVLCLRRALSLLATRLDALIAALAELAERHRTTPMAARTRFQQAVPTVLGLEVAGWLAPSCAIAPGSRARPRLLAVQLGGAAGNFLAALGDAEIAVMTALAAELDLRLPAHALAQPARRADRTRILAGAPVRLARQAEARRAAAGATASRCARPRAAAPRPCRRRPIRCARGAGDAGAPQRRGRRRHARGGAARARARRQRLAARMGLPAGHAHQHGATALTHGLTLARTVVVEPARMQATLDASHGLLLAEPASFALAQHLPRARTPRRWSRRPARRPWRRAATCSTSWPKALHGPGRAGRLARRRRAAAGRGRADLPRARRRPARLPVAGPPRTGARLSCATKKSGRHRP
ncbi:MAG: lyase family protein [Geminicoccaceae bacterium]